MTTDTAAGDETYRGSTPGRIGGRWRRPTGEPPPLPHHIPRGAWVLFGSTAVFMVLWLWAIADEESRLGIWFNEREGAVLRAIADPPIAWLRDVFEVIHSIGYSWAVPLLGWATLLLLLVSKRLRHLFVFFACLIIVTGLVVLIARDVARSRPWGLEQLAPWEGFAHPSLPVAQLTAVMLGASYSLVPRAAGRRVSLVVTAASVLVFSMSRLYLGVEYPTDALVGALVGASITVLAFELICPEMVFPVGFRRGRTAHLDLGGARGRAIVQAVSHQLGLEVKAVDPVGLADSAGSTPMRLTLQDGDTVFGKLYAESHLRSDRWYKLGRTLLYGRLEDEAPFTEVRRLVEREDYLLRLMRDAGIRASAPVGIVEITPEREYLIVTEFLDEAVELTDADVDVDMIDDALALVRGLWDHGLAHRDVKPSNVMIRSEQVYLIDVAFGQMRPSPWREAVDLANMMLCLGLRSDARLVYERALRQFSADEIAEAFAAARGITLPSQLRHQLKSDSRDLMEEFRRLAPNRRPLPIQRWSLRRIGLALWVLFLAYAGVVFGLTNLDGIGLL